MRARNRINNPVFRMSFKPAAVTLAVSVVVPGATGVSAFADTPKMPHGAFLTAPAKSGDALRKEVQDSATVLERYERKFGVDSDGVSKLLKGARLGPMPETRVMRVFYARPGGEWGYKVRAVAKGTPVFLSASDKPLLIQVCGNPVETLDSAATHGSASAKAFDATESDAGLVLNTQPAFAADSAFTAALAAPSTDINGDNALYADSVSRASDNGLSEAGTGLPFFGPGSGSGGSVSGAPGSSEAGALDSDGFGGADDAFGGGGGGGGGGSTVVNDVAGSVSADTAAATVTGLSAGGAVAAVSGGATVLALINGAVVVAAAVSKVSAQINSKGANSAAYNLMMPSLSGSSAASGGSGSSSVISLGLSSGTQAAGSGGGVTLFRSPSGGSSSGTGGSSSPVLQGTVGSLEAPATPEAPAWLFEAVSGGMVYGAVWVKRRRRS